jgi:diguanylate cyclase (GGDEF)-like protein
VGEFAEARRRQFIRIVEEEMLKQQPDIDSDLRSSLRRVGWGPDGAGEVVMDHLTRLRTREVLDRDVAAQAKDSESGRPLGAIFVDIDHFKRVNDTYGHSSGDAVLAAVAGVLQSVVEGKGHAYRYGGEEMVLLLPNHSTEEAIAVAERARRRVEVEPIRKASITASFGVACMPAHAKTADELLKAADMAVYDAKRLGRNLVRVFGEPQPNQERERQPGRKLPEPGALSSEAKRELRRSHFNGNLIRCPRDETRLEVQEVAQVGVAGRDLFVECPYCGFADVLSSDD